MCHAVRPSVCVSSIPCLLRLPFLAGLEGVCSGMTAEDQWLRGHRGRYGFPSCRGVVRRAGGPAGMQAEVEVSGRGALGSRAPGVLCRQSAGKLLHHHHHHHRLTATTAPPTHPHPDTRTHTHTHTSCIFTYFTSPSTWWPSTKICSPLDAALTGGLTTHASVPALSSDQSGDIWPAWIPCSSTVQDYTHHWDQDRPLKQATTIH